jgi:Bacterial Ig domain
LFQLWIVLFAAGALVLPNGGPAGVITAPIQGSAVAGVTTVGVSASPGVTRTELYVDGVLTQVDTTAPFAFTWDTRLNPLPAPNHGIHYGYMLVDGRYGDYRHEVNAYTNLYHAWARRGYEPNSGATDDVWLPIMQQALANAYSEDRVIYLNLNLQEETPGRITPVDSVLKIAAPFWDRIARIELADEPTWDRAQTEQRILQIRSRLTAHGLPQRPMGVIVTRDDALLTDAVFADGLDFVTIEAYVDPPGSADSQSNIDYMVRKVTEAKNRIPADKQIGIIMQAYARNGYWTNIDTLRDLQVPTYLLAYNDPRVVVIEMFSYGRATGTREHRELTTPHRLIGERILGLPIPRAGDGPRTLAVKAFDAAGNTAEHRIGVQAQLSRRGDFAGDHKADPTVFRNGQWFVYNPAIGPGLIFAWGGQGDIPVGGDYLGDTQLDPAVFRPSSGTWHIYDLNGYRSLTIPWGLPGDTALAGDYVGDARTDLTVYRPSTGVFYVKDPNNSAITTTAWGAPGDIPVAGDFIGDYKTDVAVFRPSTGQWYVRDAVSGQAVIYQWGISGDIPLAGDFLGDAHTELVIYRPSTGTWFLKDPVTGQTSALPWGLPGDVPVAGDYLGDDRSDLVVYRPSNGTFYFKNPSTGQEVSIPWGQPGDVPVA